MKARGFAFGVAGGILGAGLVLAILLAAGVFNTRTQVVVQPATATINSSASSSASGALTPAQIYQKDARSVVEIVSTFPGQQTFFGNTGPQQGIGSGFVVSKSGYILTNSHVVDEFTQPLGSGTGSSGTRAIKLSVVFNDGSGHTTTVPGTIASINASKDVALVKIDPSRVPNLTPIPLGNSNAVAVGDPVVAIGNPLGYDFSLSAGVISATDRTIPSPNGASIPNALQTDAAINPGNSGGPLINAQGQVVGINDQIASTTGGNQGLGFAISINTAVQALGLPR
jgi:S1-C subfamily serine protease